MKRDGRYILVGGLVMTALTVFLVRHLRDVNVSLTNFALAYTVMYAYLAITIWASLAAPRQKRGRGFDYSRLSVDVFVPVYNEDPALLAAGIESMAQQTRRPRTVWIVDDGSDAEVFADPTVAAAVAELRATGVGVAMHRQPNAGKRHAQAWAFERSDADVFVTVDSDTVLDRHAVQKLLVPFSRDDVTCVGGLAAGQNHRRSLLTRVVELGFVMAFLSGRQAEGHFGAVRVNCGIIAAYRGAIVRRNLDRYLGQTFLGHPVAIGDDRALTIYCKELGRAEFQREAVAYSALPETFSHLVRQRVRWARSWYWGTLWLLRRPVRSADFLITVAQCAGMLAYLVTICTAVVGTAVGAISPSLLLTSVLVSMAIGMVFSVRYVAWGRPDEHVGARLVTWLLSPLSSLLYMFVLVPLYWYAAFTLRPKDWGTRRTVEVGLHPVAPRVEETVGAA